MSRKHYILFAKMFASLRTDADNIAGDPNTAKKTLDTVIDEMCDILKSDNSNFDAEKFKDAAKAGC